MDSVYSYARQAKNYTTLIGTRAMSMATKYVARGPSAFSTPRVPHTTPDHPPSAYQNARNTVCAFFMAPTLLLDTPTFALYVGSALNTAKETTYTAEHVTHVLNCAGDEDALPVFYREQIEAYYKISMRDESCEQISFVKDPRINEGMRDFLQQAFASRDSTHKITLLVHCVFGRSRSVAISILILFLYYHHINEPKTIVECYAYIGKKRKVVALNRRFLVELTQFESCFLKDTQFRTNWMGVFESS